MAYAPWVALFVWQIAYETTSKTGYFAGLLMLVALLVYFSVVWMGFVIGLPIFAVAFLSGASLPDAVFYGMFGLVLAALVTSQLEDDKGDALNKKGINSEHRAWIRDARGKDLSKGNADPGGWPGFAKLFGGAKAEGGICCDIMPDFAKSDGLVTAIAQDAATGEVLMLAHMNQDSWKETLHTGEAHYFSRSRNKIWHKGEESGNVQKVRAIRLDCDADAVLLLVEQVGGAACHEGYRSCFYRNYDAAGEDICCPLVFDPKDVYK